MGSERVSPSTAVRKPCDKIQAGIFERELFLQMYSETLQKNYEDEESKNEFLMFSQQAKGIVRDKRTGTRWGISIFDTSVHVSKIL